MHHEYVQNFKVEEFNLRNLLVLIRIQKWIDILHPLSLF